MNHVWFVAALWCAFHVHISFAACRCLAADELYSSHEGRSNFLQWHNGMPPSYGVGCAPHDQGVGDCAMKEEFNRSWCESIVPRPSSCKPRVAPPYCHKSWCFVDSACTLLSEQSTSSADRTLYSYAVCGDTDDYTPRHHVEAMQGNVLRVAYRHNSGGSHGAYHPQPGYRHRDEQWYGPYVDLVHLMAEDIGLIVNITELPDWLSEKAVESTNDSSSFTQCVYAAGLGYVDVCVGSFSLTTPRLRLADFIHTETMPFYLAVPSENAPSFWEKAMIAFDPFDVAVWFAMGAFVVIMSILLTFQLHFNKVHTSAETTTREKIFEMLKHMSDAVYTGAVGFLGTPGLTGWYIARSQTLGSKFTVIGIVWFFRLAYMMYSSKLSALMVMSDLNLPVSNVAQAIEQNWELCVQRNQVFSVRSQFPGANLVKDPIDGKEGIVSRKHLLTYMDDGVCRASFVMDDDLRTSHRWEQHCDKMTVGDPVFFQERGFPVFRDVRKAFRMSMSNHRQSDIWRQVLQDIGPRKCKDSETNDTHTLGLSDLAAAFFVATLFALMGIVVSLIRKSGQGVGRAYDIANDSAVARRASSALVHCTTMKSLSSKSYATSGSAEDAKVVTQGNAWSQGG